LDVPISDYRLQGYYKRKLAQPQYHYAKKLKAQKYCGVNLIKQPGVMPAVFVIANNKEAKIWGVHFCDSPWSCPVCSAHRMAFEATRISCAIEALEKWYNEYAFMLTVSVPHYHNFTCKQSYDILKETWKNFMKQAGAKSASTKYDPIRNFCLEFNCTHRIRVCEFTWGKYGWHPHYHCLFFVPKNKLQQVKNWQKTFSERWFKLAKKATIKILTRDNYCDNVEAVVNKLYANSEHMRDPDFYDAKISLDEKGNVRRSVSSDYICGWGANRELTGNFRKEATAKDHFTPHQLLRKAYELDNYGKTTDNKEADKYFTLYVEYALTTFKTYRTKLSKSLSTIISNWQMTNTYMNVLKKKLEEQKRDLGKNRIVVWFKESQWYQICLLNLVDKILDLAMYTNGKQLIELLLLDYQIDITKNGKYPCLHKLPDYVYDIA